MRFPCAFRAMLKENENVVDAFGLCVCSARHRIVWSYAAYPESPLSTVEFDGGASHLQLYPSERGTKQRPGARRYSSRQRNHGTIENCHSASSWIPRTKGHSAG